MQSEAELFPLCSQEANWVFTPPHTLTADARVTLASPSSSGSGNGSFPYVCGDATTVVDRHLGRPKKAKL